MLRAVVQIAGLPIVIAVLGCGGEPTVPARVAAPRAPLRIAAASDLQTALPVLAERFTRQTGIEVSLTFGASGHLVEQIKNGGPYDVFMAANQSFVKTLAEEGAVQSDSVHPYALGSLVLVVHPEGGRLIQALSDLARPEIKKIALANPAAAPYGAAAKQTLERAKLWETLQPRIVQSESVRQALQFVETGNAEAGFVGKSIALASKKVRVVEIDRALYDPIVQGLGVVARSQRGEDTKRFCAYVLGAEGQDGLMEFGFAKAPDAEKGP